MATNYCTFAERLDGAIDHLPPARRKKLEDRYPGPGGIRAQVAAACGMPQLSTLPDIISGRMPGHMYRPVLAKVLGVEFAWLNGIGGEAPDWALSPLEAWRRFEDKLRRYGDVIDEDETHSEPENPLHSRRRRAQATRLAKAYGLKITEPFIQALAYGRYADVPFEVAIAYSMKIGMSAPTHPEHLQAGHEMWACVTHELQKELKSHRMRFVRYVPPPKLFEAIRLAIKDSEDENLPGTIADALEMLWRQQWLLMDRSRSDVPDALFEDTGRKRWRRLDEIRERWIPIE